MSETSIIAIESVVEDSKTLLKSIKCLLESQYVYICLDNKQMSSGTCKLLLAFASTVIDIWESEGYQILQRINYGHESRGT
jgi:hypothetical protein